MDNLSFSRFGEAGTHIFVVGTNWLPGKRKTFLFSRATPSAHGGSQATGQIRAAASGLHHSHRNARSELHLRPLHHSSHQRQIPNPLSEARNRTCILMDDSQIRFPCATTGTPRKTLFNHKLLYLLHFVPCVCIIYSKNWTKSVPWFLNRGT